VRHNRNPVLAELTEIVDTQLFFLSSVVGVKTMVGTR